jgi:predicted aminopeptidase
MKDGTRKIIKQTAWGLLAVLIVLVLFNFQLVVYGLQQGYGQLNIIWNAKPVEEYLRDSNFPDSLKTRLRLIDEIRKYAIDSLALKDTENYKTLYDQKGEEVMWVVLASERFNLKQKEWEFPVVGSVPYKGFFKKERALKLKTELEKEGWDVIVRNPGAWSTLGWFTDPILSKMLNRSEGDLANLIIHEMSHSTIFVKDSIDLNENLATFIGDRGAEQFLIHKYGRDSKEYVNYLEEDKDYLKYVNHMLRGAKILDSLYLTMNETDSLNQKLRLKENAIRNIVSALDTLSLALTKQPSVRFKERLPNNAFFMNYRQYQAKQDIFGDEWRTKFNSDLKRYIVHLSKKYPFL